MTDSDYPAYLGLLRRGELAVRVAAAQERLHACDLCARYCRIDRTVSLAGVVCRLGEQAIVASYGAHFGEEAPLTGWAGSGTIFFSGCNLRCLYCQNYELSWEREGQPVTAATLARMMLTLQRQGCHNINLVSPSHVIAPILAAVLLAAEQGLSLPLVYNTGGYDSLEALQLLEGIVDIYMPDMKYDDTELARRYSKVRNYVAVNRAAVREMHRQVGDLVIDANGLARRGLLIRHLVLPNGVAGSETVLRFIAEEISRHTYVNIMDQYRPCFRAGDYPPIARRPTTAELGEAFAWAEQFGLTRLAERPPWRRRTV